MVRLAKCCRPVPATRSGLRLARPGDHDPPRGLPERRGAAKDPARFTGVAWSGENAASYRVELQVDAWTARACSRISRERSPRPGSTSSRRTARPSTRWSRTASWSRSATRSSSRHASAGCAASMPFSTHTGNPDRVRPSEGRPRRPPQRRRPVPAARERCRSSCARRSSGWSSAPATGHRRRQHRGRARRAGARGRRARRRARRPRRRPTTPETPARGSARGVAAVPRRRLPRPGRPARPLLRRAGARRCGLLAGAIDGLAGPGVAARGVRRSRGFYDGERGIGSTGS